MKKENISFESASKRLEEIALELEKENISLERSLELYEEGVVLVKECKKLLDAAERKVALLGFNGDGELEEKIFDEQKSQEEAHD